MSRKEVTEWMSGLASINPSSSSPFPFAAPVIGSLASISPGAADISEKVLFLLVSRTKGNKTQNILLLVFYEYFRKQRERKIR